MKNKSPQVKDSSPSSAACSVWWQRLRTCSTPLRTWWPSSCSSTSLVSPQSAPTPFFTDFSMRISKRWQKLELKELVLAPINKDKRQKELSLWTLLISLSQSNTLVLSQAFMDCHIQWETSFQQITRQWWVGSPLGRPTWNFNSDEML